MYLLLNALIAAGTVSAIGGIAVMLHDQSNVIVAALLGPVRQPVAARQLQGRTAAA